MTATERLVDALAGAHVKPVRDGYRAKCPAHDGQSKDSLALRQIEGQALVHCHGSCATEDVMAALSMTMGDLFDEPKVGARYGYTDALGAPTRFVHRTPDKKFKQSGDTKGQPQLYRLPQVAAAVSAGTTVYVVEGEKDVHALESLGAVATTSPMGASNWPKVDASPLTGAQVVVIPDNDAAGAKYLTAVLASLTGLAASVKVMRAKVGKDAADHVAADLGLDELLEDTTAAPPAARRVTLTAASTIKVRPVRWLWSGRMPLGSLTLLAGREGIGKSTVAYTLAADLTRGRLEGQYAGQPRSVLVAATEDSWEHTIVPRLMAAGADLERVFRVDVTTSDGLHGTLSLPRDLAAVETAVTDVEAALILLDPLMSRLDGKLDTHKDAEVRIALEPLTAVADRTGASILGLIHVNKGQSTDPLNMVMASKAFTAVARAVLFVMVDPDTDGQRLLGAPKNNLGRDDLPTLTFQIDSAHVADTDEGPVWTGRVKWLGETERSIHEALDSAGEGSDARTATAEAGEWLVDYLTSQGGEADSKDIKAAGGKAGHSIDALKRARKRNKVDSDSYGFPRQTKWVLRGDPQSEQPSGSSPGESALTAPTAPTALTEGPVGAAPREAALTGPRTADPWAVIEAVFPQAAPDDALFVGCDCGWDLAPGDHFDYCRQSATAAS